VGRGFILYLGDLKWLLLFYGACGHASVETIRSGSFNLTISLDR